MTDTSARCPLCEAANHCALSADSQATSCWCQQASFSPELIEQARQASPQPRCICAACARKLSSTTTALR